MKNKKKKATFFNVLIETDPVELQRLSDELNKKTRAIRLMNDVLSDDFLKKDRS